jgi:WD40 repeat protein
MGRMVINSVSIGIFWGTTYFASLITFYISNPNIAISFRRELFGAMNFLVFAVFITIILGFFVGLVILLIIGLRQYNKNTVRISTFVLFLVIVYPSFYLLYFSSSIFYFAITFIFVLVGFYYLSLYALGEYDNRPTIMRRVKYLSRFSLVIFAVCLINALFSAYLFDNDRKEANEMTRIQAEGNIINVMWRDDNFVFVGGASNMGIFTSKLDDSSIEMKGVFEPAYDMALHPDGLMFATAFEVVEIYNVNSNHAFMELGEAIQYRIYNTVEWSPNGDKLAVTSSGGNPRGVVTVWDSSTYEVLFTITDTSGDLNHAGYHSGTWNFDGSQLAFVGIVDNVIEIRDTDTWEIILRLDGHNVPITDLAWHGENLWLASSDEGGRVVVWDVTTGSIIAEQTNRGNVRSLDWQASENNLTFGGDGGVFTWEVTTDSIVQVMNAQANKIAWDSKGEKLAIGMQSLAVVLDMREEISQ